MKQLEKKLLTDMLIWISVIINIVLISYEIRLLNGISDIGPFLIFIIIFPTTILMVIRIILFCVKNKILNIIIKFFRIVFFIASILFYIIMSGIISGIKVNSNFPYETPDKTEYGRAVKELSANEYRIWHFPVKIPKNAKNYFFRIENSFDGYDIHYLRFNIDDEYIDKVIAENKGRVYRELPYEKMLKYYKYIDSTLIEEIPFNGREPYTAYILKNENEDYRYTSGFIVSKELHKIIYFYADFNLEDYENKENTQWRKNLNS